MNRVECNWLEVVNQEDKIRDCKVLIACSGGSDSTALLHFLANVRKTLNLDLMCIYINHKLRSEQEIQGEIDFIYDQTNKLKIDFLSTEVRDKINPPFELNARNARWEIIDAIRRQGEFKYVATGHHLYDFFETILIQLNRAASDKALSGFKRIRGNRWSPLLHVRKEEMESYLTSKGISWCVDQSNFDDFTMRNKIRKVMPVLRDIVPNFEQNLLEVLNRR